MHVTIWSVRSEHVFDFTALLSEHDVFSCSLYDLLVGSIGCTSLNGIVHAPPQVAQQLTTTMTGRRYSQDTLLLMSRRVTLLCFLARQGTRLPTAISSSATSILLILPAGSSSGFNAVSIEHTDANKGYPAPPFPDSTIGFYLNRCLENNQAPCIYDLLERIDGPNGDIAQTPTNDTPVSRSSYATSPPQFCKQEQRFGYGKIATPHLH